MNRVREHTKAYLKQRVRAYFGKEQLFFYDCNQIIEWEKKILFSRKQVTKYFLELPRINTFPTLHQGVNSQRFC